MPSKQEFQALTLFLLCQAVNAAQGLPIMSTCTTPDGAWKAIKNNGAAYVSDQEFYATTIQRLCDLVTAIQAGGGGGGVGTIQVYTGATPPAAPSDPTKPALFYPTGGGGIKEWISGSSSWV